MKQVLLFLITFSILHTQAQDYWTVRDRNKIVLQAAHEDTVVNHVTLKKASLSKWGTLKLRYYENPERNDWKRTIALFGKADSEMVAAHGSKFKLRHRTLRKIRPTNNPVFI